MDEPIEPVQVKIGGTSARLLVKLCEDLRTEDATGVLSRALGLLDLVQHAKRNGKRLVLLDEATGRMQDVTA